MCKNAVKKFKFRKPLNQSQLFNTGDMFHYFVPKIDVSEDQDLLYKIPKYKKKNYENGSHRFILTTLFHLDALGQINRRNQSWYYL